MTTLTAADIVSRLGLQPHPEGGYFHETFRDETNASTAIHYLLEDGDRSHWHRVLGSAEVWHHYAGAALELSMSTDGVSISTHHLGIDFANDERPQIVVPANCWQSARSLGDWSLVGCTVAPGFDFANFEMAAADWHPGSQ